MAALLGLLRSHAPPIDLVHFVEAGHFWRGAGWGPSFGSSLGSPAAEREAEMGWRLHSGAQLARLGGAPSAGATGCRGSCDCARAQRDCVEDA